MRVSIHNLGVSTEVDGRPEVVKAPLPERATGESAAVDLRTPVGFDLPKGSKRLVDTGLIIKAPRGHCLLILPRSGLAAKKGIQIPNAPGLIDRDYCGPSDTIKVMLQNNGEEDVSFEAEDRVAQLLVTPYVDADWEEEPEANFARPYGRGGFGSTGVS